MDAATHQGRVNEAKAYHEKQKKRRGRPPKNKPVEPLKGQTEIPTETKEEEWLVLVGDKKVIKRMRRDGNVFSLYLGRKNELKDYLADKNIITEAEDHAKRLAG